MSTHVAQTVPVTNYVTRSQVIVMKDVWQDTGEICVTKVRQVTDILKVPKATNHGLFRSDFSTIWF